MGVEEFLIGLAVSLTVRQNLILVNSKFALKREF